MAARPTTVVSEDDRVTRASPFRVALISDLAEENWPSMDLVAEMLLACLERDYSGQVRPVRFRPLLKRRFTRLAAWRNNRLMFNTDRLINRFWDCPRAVRRLRAEFDLFHVVDHSYSQLVHELPASRTVVTCHDLDTFQCLLEPAANPRPRLFRAMTRRILDGFRRAGHVVCVSEATRRALLRYELVRADRITVVPNGVAPECTPRPDQAAGARLDSLLGRPDGAGPELLHVGSTVPRKRIDVLLRVLAKVRTGFPGVRLLRAGGRLTAEQRRLAEELGLTGAIEELPFLDRRELAALYRRAWLLLQPSAAEGFGLPVAEAQSCGTPVVASDLPVMREVGGPAAAYCPVADVGAWTEIVTSMLTERRRRPLEWNARRRAGIRHAARFSWPETTRQMVAIYQRLLAG